MAKTFHAQILTPEGKIFDGDVLGVKVPGVEGSFEIRMNHAPIISLLTSGQVRIKELSNDTFISVTGGFVEMFDNHLTLLAEKAELVDETVVSGG